jgi:hypothetical protein
VKREAIEAIDEVTWCINRTLHQFIRKALLREVTSRVSPTAATVQRALIKYAAEP